MWFHRRSLLFPIVLLVAGSAGCSSDSTGPGGTELYLLRRIGPRGVPTFLSKSTPSHVIIVDTLEVPLRSIRDGGTFVIHRVQVGQNASDPVWRSEGQYRGDVATGSLVVDTCPIGALCIASLVYAPFTLNIVGDSLIEVPPSGADWEPRVYGLVRRSGRGR